MSRLLDLLAVKHREDVWVPECKNGSSYGGHLRLDGLAMRRSWARFALIGYELKHSKADFRQDDKWQSYLPLVHELWFVCPPGVIQPDELPKEVGLLWPSANYTMLYTKKKAQRRPIEPSWELLAYILMARAKITHEHLLNRNPIDRWKEWLAEKDENKQLGYRIKSKVAQLLEERAHKLEVEEGRLKRDQGRLNEAKAALDRLGIDLDLCGWKTAEYVERKIKEAQTVFTKDRIRLVTEARKELERLEQAMVDAIAPPLRRQRL